MYWAVHTDDLDGTDELADLLEDAGARAGAVGRYKVIVSTIAQFRKPLSSDKSRLGPDLRTATIFASSCTSTL
ncbi:hypothetical protein E4U26_000714, partial [Claviceps purpurea]